MYFGRFARNIVFSALVIALGGCSWIPTTGPYAGAVKFDATSSVSDGKSSDLGGASIPYALVKLTPETVSAVARYEPRGLSGTFPDKYVAPTKIRFGVGDVISVTIFEAAAGGLFIPTEAGVRPGNFVTIPDQTIDNDGNISVPYAGLVKAAGRFNGEIQEDIVNRIKNRAIEPQVVVSLTQQRTSLVSVFGEVNTPNRFPAAAFGAQDRITDAITRAGGIKGQGFETWVMLQRGKKRATVPFANLVYEPSNNIYVQPGDRVYVYREQQKFLAFGATGQQGEFNFDAWRINLAEGVGKAGGLLDVQADPGSVFLYRLEPRELAELLGVDVSKFTGELIPVIFSISFRNPGGYFLATNLQMRNGDVIFVANAESVDVTKFLTSINNILATVNNGLIVGQNGIILYNAARALP
ncbi:MAG TPA: polysaccharide biosynthesis/export family protein [Terracidiphilus sp.]